MWTPAFTGGLCICIVDNVVSQQLVCHPQYKVCLMDQPHGRTYLVERCVFYANAGSGYVLRIRRKSGYVNEYRYECRIRPRGLGDTCCRGDDPDPVQGHVQTGPWTIGVRDRPPIQVLPALGLSYCKREDACCTPLAVKYIYKSRTRSCCLWMNEVRTIP